jgi:thioester reductase-like protein
VSSYHLIDDTENENDSIPEQVIRNPIAPAAIGYGESKHLAENLLDYASKRLHLLNTSIARVGQIAGTSLPEQGPPHGWNHHEWLPSLVISSRYLNAIPGTLGSKSNDEVDGVLDRIDWVPIDQLASLLVEITFSSGTPAEGSQGARVFHPINPNWVRWQSLVPTVVAALQETYPSPATEKLEVVQYEEWLKRLQLAANRNDSHLLKDNPAVKLLDFYQSLAVSSGAKVKPLAITQTLARCPSLQGVGAINPEWLCGWIKDWVLGMDS